MSKPFLLFIIQAKSEFDRALVQYFHKNKSMVLINPSNEIKELNPDVSTIDENELIKWCENGSEALINYMKCKGVEFNNEQIIVIHGSEKTSEKNIFSEPKIISYLLNDFYNTFKLYRSISNFLKEYGANILFPIYSDSLSYLDKDVGSITNHAKNAFMMTLAKEMSVSGVYVNSITIPFWANNDLERKKIRRQLRNSAFGIRPNVYLIEQLIIYIENFTLGNRVMTGQCISLLPGTEMKL
ncbi:hypothetical protein AKG98_4075 [Moritella sp. JT01]|uniref:hypothetical protein n=1 Tax=Moritella sp. JT01 TaxID=756698 RepID=UPI0007958D87|nr:hypothetical protein [Moritella sp. JT01]KXO12879.1 hypothetical protein AKG98_4075 [Moritella sp. JT01]